MTLAFAIAEVRRAGAVAWGELDAVGLVREVVASRRSAALTLAQA